MESFFLPIQLTFFKLCSCIFACLFCSDSTKLITDNVLAEKCIQQSICILFWIKDILSVIVCIIWKKRGEQVNLQSILQHYITVYKSQGNKSARKHFGCNLVSSSYKGEWINKPCTGWQKPEAGYNSGSYYGPHSASMNTWAYLGA